MTEVLLYLACFAFAIAALNAFELVRRRRQYRRFKQLEAGVGAIGSADQAALDKQLSYLHVDATNLLPHTKLSLVLRDFERRDQFATLLAIGSGAMSVVFLI